MWYDDLDLNARWDKPEPLLDYNWGGEPYSPPPVAWEPPLPNPVPRNPEPGRDRDEPRRDRDEWEREQERRRRQEEFEPRVPPGGGAPPSGSPPGPPPARDERTQFEKDQEEFRKILEGILGAISLPDFEKTFASAFGALPSLNLPSLEEAGRGVLGLADYRGLQEEALGTLDQNLAAMQAIAASRGIAQGGLQAARGRDITSRVLQGLARDINTDKLQRAQLLGNIQQNMMGLQARDLESRRGGAMDAFRAKLSTALTQQGMGLDVWKSLLQSKSTAAGQQGQSNTGLFASFLTLIGSILGGIFSDERVKDMKREGGRSADQFLDAIAPYLYNYKGDSKSRLGVMAQDVERAAPSLVRDTPAGKMIDTQEATGAVLASLARLNQRVRQLERS